MHFILSYILRGSTCQQIPLLLIHFTYRRSFLCLALHRRCNGQRVCLESGQIRDYTIVIGCFSATNTELMRKNIVWTAMVYL